MGLIAEAVSSAFERRATKVDPLHPRDPALSHLFGRPTSTAGVVVTHDTALTLSAVYACVRVLSESVAQLPLILYERVPPRGRNRATDHPLYRLLHDQPNPEMTAFEFREYKMMHLALRGNFYAEKEVDGAGRVRALWPLHPDRVRVERRARELVYVVDVPGVGEKPLPKSKIFHVRGLSKDGMVGMAPLEIAKNAIGLGLAIEEYGARFFTNNATPAGLLKHPTALKDGARKNIRESWDEIHRGLENQHRIAILEEGMDYTRVGVTAEEAQFLVSRKFSVTDVARFFRVPSHMINDLERATYSNIEHQSIEFVTSALQPWLVRIEQAIARDLLLPREQDRLYAEHLTAGLLRGDLKSRYDSYAVGRQNGWLSPDDVRELENLNPIPGGDGGGYHVQLNLVELGDLADIDKKKPAPGEDRAAAALERRALRAATLRRRIARSFAPVFRDAAGRLVRAEKREISAQARQRLGSRDVLDFSRWVDEFYRSGGEFSDVIGRTMAPAFSAYAAVVATEATREIGSESGFDALDAFTAGLVAAFVARHAESSRGQLKALVDDAARSDQNALAAVTLRLDEWDETRAERIAHRETVQVGGAVARETFERAGLRSRWVTSGSDSCPFCSKLDGRTVRSGENFASAGDLFEAEGREPLKLRRNLGHPPIHLGCDCQIVAA